MNIFFIFFLHLGKKSPRELTGKLLQRPHSHVHIYLCKYRYLRKQIYIRYHVNAFTYVSLNTPGVNRAKLK